MIGMRVLKHFLCQSLLRTLNLIRRFHQAPLLQEGVQWGPCPQTVSVLANSTDFDFIASIMPMF